MRGFFASRRRIGLTAGLLAFGILLLLPAPDGMSEAGWRTAAVAALMAVWWVTEAIPIAATALIPLALFPILGAAGIDDTAASYANPLIFLFLGGFLLALAVERWGLHRRIALSVIARVGTHPRRLLAGFMLSGGLISMWVSNTATALMLLPIGVSVVEWVTPATSSGAPSRDSAATAGFATALMLGIAYATSIGGLGTLIGTPPNALVAAFLSENYAIEVGFLEWMAVGVPIVVVALPIAYLVLVRLHPLDLVPALPPDSLAAEMHALGRMSPAERRVAAVFVLTAAAWVTRPLLERWVPGITDAGIAVAAAVVLLVLPAGMGRRTSILDWRTALRVPWGVLLLFGGGLALAARIEETGLADWLGASMGGLEEWHWLAILAVIVVAVVAFSELASNTASAAAFLPIVGALALELGRSPLLLAVPTGLAASGGFMLPVATPPNAIAYGTGRITIAQMARAGALVDVAFVVLVWLASWLLVPLVFG